MNKMIAITIRPGATTAAARLICPFACKIPPPAATRTSAKVPSNSENSRRHSRRGSSKSFRSPNSRLSMWCVRGNAAPSAAMSVPWAVAPLPASPPAAVPRVPGPSVPLTGTLSAMPQSLPSTAPKKPHNDDRNCLQVARGWCSRQMSRTQRPEPCFHFGLRPSASPSGTRIAPANSPGWRLSHRWRPITTTATATTTTRSTPSAMSMQSTWRARRPGWRRASWWRDAPRIGADDPIKRVDHGQGRPLLHQRDVKVAAQSTSGHHLARVRIGGGELVAVAW